MIYFIKKIFKDKIDDETHSQFVRFSKGIFDSKAIINVSRNGKIKISSSFEMANDLVIFAAFLAKKMNVSGIVFSRNELEGIKGGKKKGLFVSSFDEEMGFEKLSEIAKKAYSMLLDCSAPGINLKIKKKLPRPSTKSADKVNDKFCVMELDIKFWPSVRDEFLFDLPEGKKNRIINKYEINEIIIPKGETDYEKIRVLAKRKGKLTRKASVDGKELVQEKQFVA